MNCPQCQQECNGETGLRRHMSMTHGGYSVEDLKKVGVTPNRKDIARALAGNTSAKEVTEQAPDTEPKIGEVGEVKTRTRRSKTQTEDPAILAAKENILRLRCSRIASLPYSLLANVMDEPEIKLSKEEEEMLTESYLTLAKAYGWEGTSKLLLWGDVLIVQTAIVMAPERKKAIFDKLGMIGQPEAVTEQVTDTETEPIVK